MQLFKRFGKFRPRVLRTERIDDRPIIRTIEDVHDVVDHLIDDMNGAAVDIKQDEAVRLLELVYSLFHNSSRYMAKREEKTSSLRKRSFFHACFLLSQT